MHASRFVRAWGLSCFVWLSLAAVARCASPVAEDSAPAKTASRLLAKGTAWETPWYEIDSGVDGPVLLVTGGMHGNELAGFRAAEEIRHWPIVRGKMIVVPEVNKLGLAANMRWLPPWRTDSKLRDANRNFPRTKQANAAATVPCQALWELAQRVKPMWVVDLHEGFDFHVANGKSVGSSAIHFKSPSADPLAKEMLAAVNATIDDPERRFSQLNEKGPVVGGFVRAAVERLDCQGFILETTFRDQPLSLRVRQHRLMMSTLLTRLGMIDVDCTNILAPQKRGDEHHIALYDAKGTGGSGPSLLTSIFDEDPQFIVHRVGPAELQQASLDQFSLIVFPGGSGSSEASAIGPQGRKKLQAYVNSGGSYLGICAGAYLCSAHYDWSLSLVDSKVFTGYREIPGEGQKVMWRRGKGVVKIELTDEGRKIFGDWPDTIDVLYHNGPIVSPAGKADLATYRPLAYFRSEISAWEPQKGTMIDSPAILASHYGKGRVISISPHPEATAATRAFINRAALWLCEGEEAVLTKPQPEPVGAN